MTGIGLAAKDGNLHEGDIVLKVSYYFFINSSKDDQGLVSTRILLEDFIELHSTITQAFWYLPLADF